MKGKITFKGGSGSGNYGHSGRPGHVGGSGGGSGGGDVPAKSVAQSLKIAGMNLSRDGSDAQAGVWYPRLSSKTKLNKAHKELISKIESLGFKSFNNPQKTDTFRTTGGTSWRKGNTVIDVVAKPPSKFNKYGSLSAQVTRFDLIGRDVRVPID